MESVSKKMPVLNENVRDGSNKNVKYDKYGVEKTMKWYDYVGDGAGQIALNSITCLVGMLTYFYTDKVGIAAGTVGTILLVAKLFDAVSDLFMGRLIDKTKSRFGKIRPWFLWTALPTLIIIIALFTVPVDASSSIKNSYALITNILATAVVYTAIVIPYGCLMSVRTQSIEERSKMGISRAVFGYLVGTIISIGLIPITNMLGGDQAAWIKVGMIFGGASFIALIFTFLVSKEKNKNGLETFSVMEDENISFKDSVKILFKNKYWVIMLVAMLLLNMIASLNQGTGIYYVKYILGDESLIAVMGAIGLLPVIIGFVLTGPMIKFFGVARTVRISILIGAIATFIRIFMPYSFIATLVCGAFSSFSTIPMMAVGGVLVNNTVEYNEWQYGKRLVGMTNSANSFGVKVGSGLGAAMIGWLLALGKYDGTLAVQPQSANIMILVICIYLPLILLVLIYLILRKYDLDEKYPQIVKELEQRKISAQ